MELNSTKDEDTQPVMKWLCRKKYNKISLPVGWNLG
jgi:hypothetical protein